MTDIVYWIQVVEPGNAVHVVSVHDDLVAGRDVEDGLLINDPTVSRTHLRLEPTSAGLVVVDLGSANGTTVDGERISEPRLLAPGSRVRLGETELVIFAGREHAEADVRDAGMELDERPSEIARRLSRSAAQRTVKGTYRPPPEARGRPSTQRG